MANGRVGPLPPPTAFLCRKDLTMSPVNAPHANSGQLADENAGAGRTADGRFAKNNKGGPGNPYNRRVAALRQRMLDAFSPEDMEEIFTLLKIMAKSGDLAAMKLVFT